MVMKPEPWAEALDHVVAGNRRAAMPHLVVPGPGGDAVHAGARARARRGAVAGLRLRPLRGHRRARLRARREPRTARSRSSRLGDYVLNGGEVAVLAMVEAVARLLPGVIGNAESLVEESHEDGLLEYPVYTKPPVCRGTAARCRRCCSPATTARIAAWRHAAAARAHRRPPARPAARLAGGARRPTGVDAPRRRRPGRRRELLTLSRACWVQEAGRQRHARHPAPSHETLDDVGAGLRRGRPGSCAAAAGSSGSVRGRRGHRTPVDDWSDRAAHGRPGPAGPRSRPGPARPRRGSRRRTAPRFWLNTGRAQRGQPADLQQGGLPRRRRRVGRIPGRGRRSAQDAASLTARAGHGDEGGAAGPATAAAAPADQPPRPRPR